MSQDVMQYTELIKVFIKAGALSFGGWSTTALILEKELVAQRKAITANALEGAVAYAQILPGATQVSIVSNAGYQLRGLRGALVATVSYLLPAISLILLFSILYFRFASDNSHLSQHLDGLVAALSGVIIANAYKIGSKHVTSIWLWLLVGVAFIAKLWIGMNALYIILAFGCSGLVFSWIKSKKATK